MANEPYSPIIPLDDGTVQLDQAVIDAIISMVSTNCAHYAGDASGDIVGAVLATCAGYCVGSTLMSRDRMVTVQDKINRSMLAGLQDGIEDNRRLPKLHG